MRRLVLALLLFGFLPGLLPAEQGTAEAVPFVPGGQAWVSDELRIPVRTGTTLRHRILRFLRSGTPVTVLELSEDGRHVRIRDPKGLEGWTPVENLAPRPAARERLERTRQQIARLKEERKTLRARVRELEGQLHEREGSLQTLQREYDALQARLEKLERVAARPVQLARENAELGERLAEMRRRIALLEEENARLADRSQRDWFMKGAGVAIGSLLLGLLITRIPWRRRRSDW